MKLTQHYAGHNVCAPSRCVLMTGKHPGHAYIRNHRGGVGIAGGDGSEGQEPAPAGELKLPGVSASGGGRDRARRRKARGRQRQRSSA